VEHVYYTWPDRRFAYECRGCGACCKGHGIGIDVAGGQLVQLTARRPELAAFVRRRGEALTAFNPRDRCWFYRDDGLCRIEVEDGRAAKPASCRLFPFNRVFRVGAYTVVDFNSVICPLRAVAAGGVAHADVLAEIAAIHDAAIVGTSLPADDAVIAREKAVAAQLFAAADVAAAWSAQDPSPLASARAPVAAAFSALLDVEWAEPTEATLAAALPLSPSLRFNELYGPRQYLARARMAPTLARMWLGWLGFAALGERLAQRPLGMQELTTLWSEQAPLAFACARWHDVPSLKPGPIELPGVDPHGLVKGLAQRFVDNRAAQRPLGVLVAAAFADVTAPARVAALKLAEPILRAGFAASG
jgi:Fe-S-cluster containining protein